MLGSHIGNLFTHQTHIKFMCKFTCKIFVINYAVMFISLFLIVLRYIACLFGNQPLLPPKIMKQCIEHLYSSTIYRFIHRICHLLNWKKNIRFTAIRKSIHLWSGYASNIMFINNHWRLSKQQKYVDTVCVLILLLFDIEKTEGMKTHIFHYFYW